MRASAASSAAAFVSVIESAEGVGVNNENGTAIIMIYRVSQLSVCSINPDALSCDL